MKSQSLFYKGQLQEYNVNLYTTAVVSSAHSNSIKSLISLNNVH